MFVEMNSMKEPKNYTYGATSCTLGYCVLGVLLGSYNWTQGLLNGLCAAQEISTNQPNVNLTF